MPLTKYMTTITEKCPENYNLSGNIHDYLDQHGWEILAALHYDIRKMEKAYGRFPVTCWRSRHHVIIKR